MPEQQLSEEQYERFRQLYEIAISTGFGDDKQSENQYLAYCLHASAIQINALELAEDDCFEVHTEGTEKK